MGAETDARAEFDKLQEAVVGHKPENEEPDIKFGVGMSQDWDPYRAGVQAASKALEQVNYKPKFLLIFCTAYYARKEDGLIKLLKGCRDLVGDKIPSIGGVTTAFICPEGCYSRGVAVVAGGGKEIDVASAFSDRIRQNPQEAGSDVARCIKHGLKDSKKKHKILIEVMPAPREPPQAASPFMQSIIKVLPNKAVIWLRNIIFEAAIQYLNFGQGRETEALKELESALGEYYVIGTSTFDDFRDIDHFQFYGNQVFPGAISAIGLSLNNEIIFEREPPKVVRSGVHLKVKTGWRRLCIDEINKKPAVTEFLRVLDWPKDYAEPHIRQIFHRNYYYPLGYEENGMLLAFPAGFFMGETINTNREIRAEEVEVLHTSSDKIFSSLTTFLDKLKTRKIEFTLLFDASEVPGFLGDKLYFMKKMIDENVTGSPYLVLFGAGEHSKKPNEIAVFNNFSRVDLTILRT